MAERDLRRAAREIQEHVPDADFSRIAERGHSLRRRRRALQVVGAASAVVVAVVVGVTVPWTDDRGPVAPPSDPALKRTPSAQQVLSDPQAVVDDDVTEVSDTGSVLHLVAVPSAAGGACPADREVALVWQDESGEGVAWSEDVAGRRVEAVPGGFVVGAVLPECADQLGADGARGAYVVGDGGEQRAVTWTGGAEEKCAVDPAAPVCAVDATTGVGELRDEPVPVRASPDAAHQPLAVDGDDVWARSVDSREIVWSRDGGRSWQRHTTSVDEGRTVNVQVTAAGDWMVFYAWPLADVSSDHGRSWQTRDLSDALSPILLAEEAMTVTADGILVGVSQPIGGPSVLFASTDERWTRFVEADVETAFGGIEVRTAGEWLWVPDQGRVWLSGDQGLTWTVVDPVADHPAP